MELETAIQQGKSILKSTDPVDFFNQSLALMESITGKNNQFWNTIKKIFDDDFRIFTARDWSKNSFTRAGFSSAKMTFQTYLESLLSG